MNKDKAQKFLPSSRVKEGYWLLLIETLINWAAHTALVIATAYYLWHPEEKDENICKACNADYETYDSGFGFNTIKYTNPEDCAKEDQLVDVQERFTTILRIYFAFFIV